MGMKERRKRESKSEMERGEEGKGRDRTGGKEGNEVWNRNG